MESDVLVGKDPRAESEHDDCVGHRVAKLLVSVRQREQTEIARAKQGDAQRMGITQ